MLNNSKITSYLSQIYELQPLMTDLISFENCCHQSSIKLLLLLLLFQNGLAMEFFWFQGTNSIDCYKCRPNAIFYPKTIE